MISRTDAAGTGISVLFLGHQAEGASVIICKKGKK